MISLAEIAQNAMRERGFYTDFPSGVVQELQGITAPASGYPEGQFQDLRNRPWISIDNDDSLDLDQLTYSEITPEGVNKAFVAVADVDSLVKKNSAIDVYAAHNTTSVYPSGNVFPMLPPKLSTNFTSLNPNEDRCAIVIEIEIGNEGSFDRGKIYLALVRNQAKLAYGKVAEWLTQQRAETLSDSPITFDKVVADQLRLQDSLAQKMKEYRYRQGALSLSTIEVEPVFENGMPVALRESIHNRAHTLIENFMIAANVAVTRFLTDQQLPTILRVVRTPKRWDRIVALAKERGTKLPLEPDGKALRDFLSIQKSKDSLRFPDLSLAVIKLIGRGEYVVGMPGKSLIGHFDLGLLQYAHTTAPNRRFPDLIMQRLLKGHFFARPAEYTINELTALATHCTEKEDDATKVERLVRKSAAAIVLSSQIGQEYEALVTGAAEKGTWVRLMNPPIEGKLVAGFQGLDVGDRVKVKLVAVDVPQGYIDFIKA